MHGIPLNIGVVLGAGLARFFFGWIWWMPFLFGNIWMAELKKSGMKEKEIMGNMPKGIVTDLLASAALAFVLAHAVKYALLAPGVPQGVTGGIMVAFFNWLGLVLAVQIGSLVYEGRSPRLFWINMGYNFCTFLLMGVILALWA